MNRPQLQALALERILDAEALLVAGRWAAAYYLTGYAVECGLKSCVLRYLDSTGVIFRDRDYLKVLADCWTHDLVKLVKIAGLDADFGVARGVNPVLEAYWAVVKDWKETSRYETKTEPEARGLHEAVTNDPHGVLPWIKTRW
ncbi:MAG: hypothetical protein K2W96_26365 [Gemmataceae bacterium]|nr:hypothetical protein [Gemmataceae bacterium]